MKKLLLNPEVRSVWQSGSGEQLLEAYEKVWERKRILRQIYETWYQQILGELQPGRIIEVGAGTGNFKRWLQVQGRSCWTLDILPGQSVDVQGDALDLPFRAGSVDNIVMIDALHHFMRPFAFLTRAATVLRPGGRLVLVEPFVSVWGWFVYKYLHHERVDFGFSETDGTKDAWDGNAAIPQLVLDPQSRSRFPLRVVRIRYCEFLAYPLSGGFSYQSLLPGPVLSGLHALEKMRLFQNRLVSLRQVAVLEKTS